MAQVVRYANRVHRNRLSCNERIHAPDLPMGGDIEIIAHFPNRGGGKDKTIKLKPFVEDAADAAQARQSGRS